MEEHPDTRSLMAIYQGDGERVPVLTSCSLVRMFMLHHGSMADALTQTNICSSSTWSPVILVPKGYIVGLEVSIPDGPASHHPRMREFSNTVSIFKLWSMDRPSMKLNAKLYMYFSGKRGPEHHLDCNRICDPDIESKKTLYQKDVTVPILQEQSPRCHLDSCSGQSQL